MNPCKIMACWRVVVKGVLLDTICNIPLHIRQDYFLTASIIKYTICVTWNKIIEMKKNKTVVIELSTYNTINVNDMLSCSLTTIMWIFFLSFYFCLFVCFLFLTKEQLWFSGLYCPVNLFIKAYDRITYKEDLKITWKRCDLEMIGFSLWFWFWCAFITDHLRSISFFCQNAHHNWLTKIHIKLVSSVSYWTFK